MDLSQIAENLKPSLQQASIGDILLSRGQLTAVELERIVALQKKENILFGEAAVGLGILTDEEVRMALACQYSYPRISTDDAAFSDELLVVHDPFCSTVEAFRTIRSGLILYGAGKIIRTIGILSSDEGDGKTFAAANLAIVFAQQGARTVLVDLNLRKPRIHELFKLRNNCGATSLIIKRALYEQAVSKTSINTLDIITSGPKPPNPLELIGWNDTQWMVDSLRETYDIVLIDTPSFSRSSDAKLISSMCDASVLVVRKGVTKLKSFGALKRHLDSSGVKVLGTVFNEETNLRT